MLRLPTPESLPFDCRRKQLIARLLATVACPIASVFFIINLYQGLVGEALADAFMALVAGALFLAARPSADLRRAYIRLQALLIFFLVSFMALEINSVFIHHLHSRLLWFIPLPLLIFAALGKRAGSVVSLCFGLALGGLLVHGVEVLNGVWFTSSDAWRFLGAFLSMCLVGFFIEHTLRRDRKQLMGKQLALERSEEQYRAACLYLVQEIYQRNQAEVSKQGLVEQLRKGQKMEALGQLAGGVAHDLNNLLGSMMGFTHIAHTALSVDNPQKENLSLALEAGKTAQSLLRRLLDFSRHEEPDREPLHIGKLLRGSLKLVRPLLAPTVTLRSKLPESDIDDLIADANAVQMEQVLFNLCQNASQAMAQHGGKLTVELSEARITKRYAKEVNLEPGNYALLEVSDTGPGLSLPVLEKVFDPSYTTKDKGKGTGMGLFVTRGIVEAHGGIIRAQNRLRGGARFSVYLPLCQQRPVEQAAPEPAEMPQGKGQRVLYVDDDKSLAMTVRMVMEELGYRIELCGSAEEALGMLHSGELKIDVLISDQNMNGVSGKELARQCRRLHPDLPVIITTGSAGLFNSEELRNLGVRDILSKPVSARRMARAIDQALK